MKSDPELRWRSQPISEKIHQEVLSLPMGPHLTEAQAAAVIQPIREFTQ